MPYRKSKPCGTVKPPVGSMVDWTNPINTGLISRWLLNENAGMRASNIVKNIHGTLTGFAAPPTSTSGWIPGKFGPAVVCVSGAYIVLPGNLFTQSTNLTISLWINFSLVTGTYIALFSYYTADGDSLEIFKNTGSGQIMAGHFTGAGESVLSAAGATAPGSWYNVVYQTIAGTGQIWINGQKSGSAVGSANAFTTFTVAGAIGARTGGSFPLNFYGILDNVAVWNRGLFDTEIARIYYEPFAGIVAPRRRIISAIPAAVTSKLLLRRRRMAI